MMKKGLLLAILCFMCIIGTYAQDSPFVGTWEGTVTSELPDPNSDGTIEHQYKLVVKITQYDDDYGIRMKSVSIEDPSKVYKRFDNCDVIYYDDNTIKWKYLNSTSYDWDSSDRKNGDVIYCAVYAYYYTATYSKGRLTVVNSCHTDYKNRSGKIIGTHDHTIPEVFNLYKQEDNW